MDKGLNNVDDMVTMLDKMFEEGQGHINVSYDPDKEGKQVQTLGCLECTQGKMACDAPTLHEGIDEAFDEL